MEPSCSLSLDDLEYDTAFEEFEASHPEIGLGGLEDLDPESGELEKPAVASSLFDWIL